MHRSILFSIFTILAAMNANASVELRSATMIGGDYAVRLVYSTNMTVDNFDESGFYAKADVSDPNNSGSTLNEKYTASFAYVDPLNPKAVIVTFTRRIVDWITWGVCIEAKNTKLYYDGSWMKSTTGDAAPVISGITPKRMAIYNNSATGYYHYGRENDQLYVEGVPCTTKFTSAMWSFDTKDKEQDLISNCSTTVYVNASSSAASDTNAGTSIDAPLKTIAAGVKKLSAGARMVIGGGTYRETLNINGLAGTAGAPIIIEGISATDSTFVSAANSITTAWTDEGNGILSTSFAAYELVEAKTGISELGKHRENLFVDHNKYNQVLTLSELQSAGTGTYCVVNGKLYAKFPTDFKASEHLIEVNKADGVCLQATGTAYIVLRNLNFIEAGSNRNLVNSQDNTIFNSMESSNHILLDNCSFSHSNNFGLSLRGHDITIEHCSFNDNGGTGLQINHNGMTNYDEASNVANYNIVIEGCNFLGNNWRMGTYGGIRSDATAGLNSATWLNGIVRSCRFENTDAAAIWMDIHHSNLNIHHNIFKKNVNALWLEIGFGGFDVESNLMSGSSGANIIFGHSQNVYMAGNLFSDMGAQALGFAWLGGDGDSREECHKTVYLDFERNIVLGAERQLTYFPVQIKQSDTNIWDFSSLYNTSTFNANTYYSTVSSPFIGQNGNTPFTFNEWKEVIGGGTGETTSELVATKPLDEDNDGNYTLVTSTTPMSIYWNFPVATMSNEHFAMSNSSANMTYRYTTDGHLPTETSQIVNGTIDIPAGGCIIVMGFADGLYCPPIIAKSSVSTGIDDVVTNKGQIVAKDDYLYNLCGQQVGADYKGIVIKNGKKLILK